MKSFEHRLVVQENVESLVVVIFPDVNEDLVLAFRNFEHFEIELEPQRLLRIIFVRSGSVGGFSGTAWFSKELPLAFRTSGLSASQG